MRPPSDKSITHRAFLLSAMAEGEAYVRRPLLAEDCLAMLSCCEKLGLEVKKDGSGFHLIPHPWASPESALDCGNSGTAMRLLAGAISGHYGVEARLTGDASLRQRPMKRATTPLREMGAHIEGDTPPLSVGGEHLNGIDVCLDMASAQVKSAILLAGLRAKKESTVFEPSQSRNHTELMLRAMGGQIRSLKTATSIEPGPLRGIEVDVPGDISSAAFWIVAAHLLPGSELVLRGLGVNPTRAGLLEFLPHISEGTREQAGEMVAEVIFESLSLPPPFRIEGEMVPRLIDEIPILAVLATQLKGRSLIKDAAELRVKESDRIETTASFLTQMGAEIEVTDDGMIIEGPTPLSGGIINPAGDHRIAMSAAVAGLIAKGETLIQDAQCIATSYPEFVKHMEHLVEY